jgi:hypothetical protein
MPADRPLHSCRIYLRSMVFGRSGGVVFAGKALAREFTDQ